MWAVVVERDGKIRMVMGPFATRYEARLKRLAITSGPFAYKVTVTRLFTD